MDVELVHWKPADIDLSSLISDTNKNVPSLGVRPLPINTFQKSGMRFVEIQHSAQFGNFQLNFIQVARSYFCSVLNVGLDTL